MPTASPKSGKGNPKWRLTLLIGDKMPTLDEGEELPSLEEVGEPAPRAKARIANATSS